MGFAKGIKFERCIVNVIVENPIPVFFTIENLKDHSPQALGVVFVAEQREDPKKTTLVGDYLDRSPCRRLPYVN